jgi:hypothetical protein
MVRYCALLLILCTASGCAETIAPRTPQSAPAPFISVAEPVAPEQAEALAARHPACASFGSAPQGANAVAVALVPIGAVLHLPPGFRSLAEVDSAAPGESQAWMGPDSSAIFLYPFDGTGAFSFGLEGQTPRPEGVCSARFAGRLAPVLTFTAAPVSPRSDTLFLAVVEVVLRPGASLGVGVLSPTREGRSHLLAAIQTLRAPEP